MSVWLDRGHSGGGWGGALNGLPLGSQQSLYLLWLVHWDISFLAGSRVSINSSLTHYILFSLGFFVSVDLFSCLPTRTHPSIISWAIHCSGLHTEWGHSSHNYCGGSHTLHQSIPVSKSPGENSERIRFPKRYYGILVPPSEESQTRGEEFSRSFKVTSWLSSHVDAHQAAQLKGEDARKADARMIE